MIVKHIKELSLKDNTSNLENSVQEQNDKINTIKQFRIDCWKSIFGLEKGNLKYFDYVSPNDL